MRFSTKGARGFHYCRSSSPPFTVCRDNGRRIPGPIMSYFLNFGYNHERGCYRLLGAKTEMVAYSRDVTWHHPETPWITPIRAAPREPQMNIYVPMPHPVPIAAPSPAPVATPPAPALAETLPPAPTPTSNSPAPIPPRVSRELEHEEYVEMPGRTRAETCALRGASREYALAMVYHCTMQLWCRCWRKAKQPTRLFANMAPPKTRRTCRPRMHRI